jgi:Fe2+ transport system protein FeoA
VTPAPRACEDAPAVRLSDARRRSRLVVVRLRAATAVAERLHSVGLGVGAELTVVRAGLRPTVRVGSSRLALGPDLSRAIEVRAVPEPT